MNDRTRIFVAASEILRNLSRSKKAMTAAGIALTQRHKTLGAKTSRKDYSLAGEALRK